MNSPGDTSLDSRVGSAGGSGSVLGVNTGLEVVTPEVAYGLVLDTVGCGSVNLRVSSSGVV